MKATYHEFDIYMQEISSDQVKDIALYNDRLPDAEKAMPTILRERKKNTFPKHSFKYYLES